MAKPTTTIYPKDTRQLRSELHKEFAKPKASNRTSKHVEADILPRDHQKIFILQTQISETKAYRKHKAANVRETLAEQWRARNRKKE